ncbi:MAG: hypothetical protein ACPGCO_08425 [Flavobacteriaceae bacterium]
MQKSQVETTPQNLHNKIIGEWHGTDETGESIVFVFSENRDLKWISGNVVMDTETLGANFSWRLDTNHDPMHLDMLRAPLPDEDAIVLPAIIRFVKDNKIQIRMSEDLTSRPIGFTPSDVEGQILFTRQ